MEYYGQLENRTKECDILLGEIDNSLQSLNKLTSEYDFVFKKTSALHSASENLLQEQNKLNDISEDIKKRLKYFTQAENISQRLLNPTFSVSNDTFVEILNTIDDCLDYMRINVRKPFNNINPLLKMKLFYCSPSSPKQPLSI
jgi:hypothetical protein